jgi:two-component system, chemotaxis family, protein-glutamate methylesterase/glutaminase
MDNYKAVVMGLSAGGMEALETILPMIEKGSGLAYLIVLHRGKASDDFFINHMDSISKIKVVEARDKMNIEPEKIYFAPAGYHLLVEHDQTLSLSVDPRVNFARPSIDVLFETSAEAYRNKLIGVIMTGSGSDGAKGLAKIKAAGGLCIVQDPDHASTPFMPENAIKAVKADHILHLDKISSFFHTIDKKQAPI